jgi:hypothetical protein
MVVVIGLINYVKSNTIVGILVQFKIATALFLTRTNKYENIFSGATLPNGCTCRSDGN